MPRTHTREFAYKSDAVDVLMHIHWKREKSVLASTDGNREKAVFLPLSQIQFDPNREITTVTMPEWLANEKGLI